MKRARKEGKWVGQVPAGFLRVDGYLKPNMDPDYAEGETGYLDIADALERLDEPAIIDCSRRTSSKAETIRSTRSPDRDTA